MRPGRTGPHLTAIAARAGAGLALACMAFLISTSGRASGILIKDDLFIGVWSPFASRWEAEAAVCIWGDSVGETYRITATGLSSDTRFELSSDSDESIRYQVLWFPQLGQGRGDRLSPGVASRSSIVVDSDRECEGGANSSIRVSIRDRQIDRAPPGIYDDTLLVILSPL